MSCPKCDELREVIEELIAAGDSFRFIGSLPSYAKDRWDEARKLSKTVEKRQKISEILDQTNRMINEEDINSSRNWGA